MIKGKNSLASVIILETDIGSNLPKEETKKLYVGKIQQVCNEIKKQLSYSGWFNEEIAPHYYLPKLTRIRFDEKSKYYFFYMRIDNPNI